jgi:hypothetical protein
MGASASIQTTEVQLFDKKGIIFPKEEIEKINNKVFIDFNYGFYKKYSEPNAYETYKNQLYKHNKNNNTKNNI